MLRTDLEMVACLSTCSCLSGGRHSELFARVIASDSQNSERHAEMPNPYFCPAAEALGPDIDLVNCDGIRFDSERDRGKPLRDRKVAITILRNPLSRPEGLRHASATRSLTKSLSNYLPRELEMQHK